MVWIWGWSAVGNGMLCSPKCQHLVVYNSSFLLVREKIEESRRICLVGEKSKKWYEVIETSEKMKNALRETQTLLASKRTLAVVRFGHRPPAHPSVRPLSQTHRQDRLQYTAPQCNEISWQDCRNKIYPLVNSCAFCFSLLSPVIQLLVQLLLTEVI